MLSMYQYNMKNQSFSTHASSQEIWYGEGMKAQKKSPDKAKQLHRVLMFDPTPAGLIVNKSLRSAFKGEWDRIRKKHFKEYDFSCEICKEVKDKASEIDAHEVYSFPNPQIVHLARIVFICKCCHHAIHLERTRLWCGAIYVQKVEDHYRRVNGNLSKEDFQQDFREAQNRALAIREYYGGAAASPDLDYGIYQEAIEKCLARKKPHDEDDEDSDDDSEIFPDHECPWDVGHAD